MHRFTSTLFSLLLWVFPGQVHAQDFSSDAFDAKAYVSDLNVVAEIWKQDELSNADVSVIASVGCGLVRKVAADELLLNTANWFETVEYPEPNVIQETGIEEFVAFEVAEFRKAGATDAAIALVEQALFDRVSMPLEAPFIDKDLLIESDVETSFCNARFLGGVDPNAPAGEAEVFLAAAATDVIVGTTTIAIDVLISMGSGGMAAGIMTILSGGVGYDLIKKGLGG
ncbi:hypothetical protein ACXYMP_06030 [Aliiroseovarius sp. CAU 1755]